MFELSFVKKYLSPKKGQLSASLIALLSVAMITVVVWLVVVFLSVTEGIEKNWLNKLTALNAPLRVQPTQEYFSSYYYNVDKYSSASQYLSKTLGQKARALISNPYDPEFDEELPAHVHRPDVDVSGQLKDPVQLAIKAFEELHLAYEDIEMTGALMRLELIRPEEGSSAGNELHSQLTHVSYLANFAQNNPSMPSLLLPPTEEDLNHLLFLSHRSSDEGSVLEHCQVKQLKTKGALWSLPLSLLPEKVPFLVEAYQQHDRLSHLIIPDHPQSSCANTVERRGDTLFYKAKGCAEIPLKADDLFLLAQGPLLFDVDPSSKYPDFVVRGHLQNKGVCGTVDLKGLEIAKAVPKREWTQGQTPPWPFFQDHKPYLPQKGKQVGVVIAKSFQESGVHIGDSGTLSYSASSLSGSTEKKIPIFVAGFYDPGIMAVGNKCILVPKKVTEAISGSDQAFTLDRSEANSFFVWFKPIDQVEKMKEALLQKLEEKGVGKYWKVQTFREYDFAKDLMQQFQSDKYLFTLLALIILLVACTNIISLLVLLVSDKKKEIGILRAMGAKRRSIAAIFALSGAGLGFLGCFLGLLLSYFTLQNIDQVVLLLSRLQGHQAFNTQFFGSSLPHTVSPRALVFVAITTPILAFLAGIVPAIKAARLNPCHTLRSE